MRSVRQIADRFLAGQSCSRAELERLHHDPTLALRLTQTEQFRLWRVLQNSGILLTKHGEPDYLDANFHASVYRED